LTYVKPNAFVSFNYHYEAGAYYQVPKSRRAIGFNVAVPELVPKPGPHGETVSTNMSLAALSELHRCCRNSNVEKRHRRRQTEQ
jgi:hypothetical protein